MVYVAAILMMVSWVDECSGIATGCQSPTGSCDGALGLKVEHVLAEFHFKLVATNWRMQCTCSSLSSMCQPDVSPESILFFLVIVILEIPNGSSLLCFPYGGLLNVNVIHLLS